MIELSIVPDSLLAKIDEKGIPSTGILLAVRSDMNADAVACDNWMIVTADDLICIGGTKIIVPKTHRSPLDRRHLEVAFGEISYTYFPLSTLSDFSVEDLISGARLTAKNTESGHPVLVTLFSNTTKQEIQKFVRYLNEYKKDGKITESTDPEEDVCCPKCGDRYADPNRKICPRCMDRGHLVKRLLSLFSRYYKSVVLICLTLIMTSALAVIAPYVSSGFYYDQVLNKSGKFYGQLLLVLMIVITTALMQIGVNILSGVISSSVAAKVVYDLKKTIFEAIERLSISFFTSRQTGGLMTQVNNDATSIYWFFCDGFPYFLINIVQTLTVTVIMFIMNYKLALVAIVIVPVMIFVIVKLFNRIDMLHARRFSRSRAMNATLSDVLNGVRVVKAFSKEKNEIKRFDSRSRSLASAERDVSRYGNIAFPAASFIIYIGNISVWAIGGWMVIKGFMTYGMLLTFVAYMNMIYSPMFFFVDMVYWAAECFNALQRLSEIADAKPEVCEADDPIHIDHLAGKVEFKDVKFSYDKNKNIIDGITFTVEPGKILGIVGHTGAGKSTLANLLIRLYDTSDGEILIDGHNVRDIALDDLRRNIAIVSQETYLFAGTISDNIKYSRPDATREEIIQAAKISGAHDFIIKMPDAYSTKVGFGAKDLSGGERQRISIARAVLRNPKILILDEATAAMDTETERSIQRALERLTVGRTTIIIAHRLSTLREADSLIVIENGKMPEAGTHLELINKKGIYYNLYKLQAEALKNVGIEA